MTTTTFDPHRDGGIDRQPDVARTTHAEQTRTLLAAQSRALLSTVAREPAGYPFGSLVTYVADETGSPWILISTMAEHTRNAEQDSRASMLISDQAPDDVDPLALARVSLVGDLQRQAPTGDVREEFLRRNPGARSYVDFPDFGWWRLNVSAVRYVGGFGRMSWVETLAFATAEPDPIAPHATGIVTHMNDDHLDSQIVLVRHYLGHEASEARMTAVDRLGCELDVVTPTGPMPLRLPFLAPVADASDVRQMLVRMLADARTS